MSDWEALADAATRRRIWSAVVRMRKGESLRLPCLASYKGIYEYLEPTCAPAPDDASVAECFAPNHQSRTDAVFVPHQRVVPRVLGSGELYGNLRLHAGASEDAKNRFAETREKTLPVRLIDLFFPDALPLTKNEL
jgi:hypothetical protein